MKVLLLTHRMPFPITDGQSLRIHHYLDHLSARHDFALVTHGTPPHPGRVTQLVRTTYAMPRRPPLPARSALDRLARSIKVDELFDRDPEMSALIREAVRKEEPDVVWVSGWDMTAYIDDVAGTPVVADIVDEGSLEYSRELVRSQSPAQALRNLRLLLLSVAWERRYFSRAAVCTVVSSRDAARLRRFCSSVPVHVIENGVDTDHFKPLGQPPLHPSIVFEGNMSFPPNGRAARFLVRRILPRVRAAIPEASAFIVGRDPTSEVLELQGDGVLVTGLVADIRPYLDRASLFACPMITGAGIKNKILQAWAMAKPVVATSVAAGGLRTSNHNIVIRDDEVSFANAIVALLRDPAEAARLGHHGRETVLRHYPWPAKAADLERTFQAATQTRGHRRAD